MASNTLPVLTRSVFPQVLEDLVNYEIRRVDRILAQNQLKQCYWSDEHCDCRELATIHHLQSQQEFCERHYRRMWYEAQAAEVTRG